MTTPIKKPTGNQAVQEVQVGLQAIYLIVW